MYDPAQPGARLRCCIHFGVRMFGVLRFVILPFFLGLEKASGGNAEPQNIEQANVEGKTLCPPVRARLRIA